MKILKASDRAVLLRLLDLPSGAERFYQDIAGSFYGDTVEDVLRFALISWLHLNSGAVNKVLWDRANRLDNSRGKPVE